MEKGQETIFFSFILGLVTFQQFSTFFPIIILLDCMRLNIFFFFARARKKINFACPSKERIYGIFEGCPDDTKLLQFSAPIEMYFYFRAPLLAEFTL